MPTYLAFYKPLEVLCQFTDRENRATLADYIPISGVYAVGRLDYLSEGLLLLSDDGPLNHRLTTPDYHHTKIYLVQVEGQAGPEAIERLNGQIVVPSIQTGLPQVRLIPPPDLPARAVRAYHPTSWLEVRLEEGKKHQVRRMTAAVGLPTLRLVRVAIGPLELGSLQPGQWRRLESQEIRALRTTVGLPARSGA
jgi:23S rRNA pseudouridine2457 synthase